MGVLFREAGPGISECGGSSMRGCREIGGWGGARNHPQSLLGGGGGGQNWQGPGCQRRQSGESKGRKAPGMASVLLSETETSGREQIWQRPFREATLAGLSRGAAQ